MNLGFLLSLGMVVVGSDEVRAETLSARILPGSSVLVGRIEGTGPCAGGENQIWVSRDHTLLYQAAAMPGATFEFHVMPGDYEVVVTSSRGCAAEAHAEPRANEAAELVLTLSDGSTARKPAGRNPATSGMLTPYNCPTCFGNGGMIAPFRSPFTAGPWWLPYGAMSYPNFYAPGPWGSGGFMPSYYPGWGGGWMHGGGMMGKPNVYVRGPKGQRVAVRVLPQAETHLLAAVPAHGAQGWTAVTGDGYRIRAGQADLGYLFYDYRFNPSVLQKEEGFCTDAASLMPRLTSLLSTAGFEAIEVKDFREYWTVKLPRADSYCVYPQDERVLGRLAKLEVKPAPRRVVRVGFMIVPRGAKHGPSSLFSAEPSRPWQPHALLANGRVEPLGADRTVASQELTVYEWGVGFLNAP